ncbi:Rieske (2Fe-2S) protein [Streptomyces sp. ICBB 8177]|uniref:Rieske (2Fe-2S) protein n=1 Tax=Streptomyces sp. ICBB 8177 TaxID=563922 RepID=UPI000D67FB08|nr:Rieske (2Fe-2S) protein [Streptomyces sp. ICBB 8177]PWI45683.1 Rieske (2Fe-2S) protein [Streptomyces sp. ICBB 8177]
MEHIPGTPVTTSRRTLVAAAGATGLAAVLAACGGSKGNGADSSPSTSGDTSGGASGGMSGGSSGTSGGASGATLAKTSDIPEGGGRIFADQRVVVTQPTAGQFKGFSAVCTHQQCTVSEVKDGTINCPCHGSKFHIADGSVANGPATQPLPAANITVTNGAVKLG